MAKNRLVTIDGTKYTVDGEKLDNLVELIAVAADAGADVREELNDGALADVSMEVMDTMLEWESGTWANGLDVSEFENFVMLSAEMS